MKMDERERQPQDRLEEDLINAIKARGLREQMTQWCKEEEGEKPIVVPVRKPRIVRLVVSMSAVAALLFGVVFLTPQSWRDASYRWAYRQYVQYFHKSSPQKATKQKVAKPDTAAPAAPQLTPEELLAGTDKIVTEMQLHYMESSPLGANNLIAEAAVEIESCNYSVALTILSDARESLDDESGNYKTTEQDICMLEAICYMGLDKRNTARQLLEKLVEENPAAAELLKRL